MGYLQLAICVCFVAAQAYGHALVDSRLQLRVKQLLDTIITPEYNINLRPYGVNDSSATLVSVYLRNLNILELDETNGRLTFQGFFEQTWVDPRLAFNDSEIRYIPLRECKTIWSPDLFLENAVEGPLSSPKTVRVLKVYPNGRVFYSVRVTPTLNCPALMNLENKEVICPTSLGSYGYRSDDIQVAYSEGQGFDLREPILLRPKYTLAGVTTTPTCDLAGRKAKSHEGLPLPTYSCLGFNFKLTRA